MEIEYCSVENCNNDDIRERIMFYAQEKINGANFRIHTDGGVVTYGSRDVVFNQNEDWCDYQLCMRKHAIPTKLLKLLELTRQEHPDVLSVTVFGELFGRCYPGFPKIHTEFQCKTMYHPETEFLAYDICFESMDNNIITFKYTNEPYMTELFEATGIPYLRVLKFGMIDELLNMNLRINSTIPSYYDLPELPNGSNIIEGIVIRPKYPMYYANGKRVIIKKKNPEFDEKHYSKTKIPIEMILSDTEKLFLSEVQSRITEARYNSVMSKHPHMTKSTNVIFELMRTVSKEFYDDIINEMDREHVDTNHKDDKRLATMNLKSIQNLIRPFIVDRVNSSKE